MSTVKKILKARGKVHGDFTDHARITQRLKSEMGDSVNWQTLPHIHREALEMIQHKIGRILSGNPHHKDHWDDIAGYATLVAERVVNTKPSG